MKQPPFKAHTQQRADDGDSFFVAPVRPRPMSLLAVDGGTNALAKPLQSFEESAQVPSQPLPIEDARAEGARKSPTTSKMVFNFFSQPEVTETQPIQSGRTTLSTPDPQGDALRPILYAILRDQKQITNQLAEMRHTFDSRMHQQSSDIARVSDDVARIKRLIAENALHEVLQKLHA